MFFRDKRLRMGPYSYIKPGGKKGIYYLITILVNYIRLKRLHNEVIERYIADVLKFE